MRGALGTGQFWWWEAIHAGNLYQPFRGIAAFVAGEDMAAHNFKAASAKASKTSQADVYGLQSSDYALLWVISSKFTDTNYKTLVSKNLDKKVANPMQVTFPDVQGLTLWVKGLADGEYTIAWWDTQNGKAIQTDKGTSSAGLLEVPMPTFQTDLAVKVRKVS